MPYYSTQPHPAEPGRWLVVHRTVDGLMAADEDCPSLTAAEKAAAWLEAERSATCWAPPARPDRHGHGARS